MSDKRFLKAIDVTELPELVWEELEVPEWKGWVRVKMLSARERDEFEASMMTVDKNGRPQDKRSNARARLVQLAVVDEQGNQLFSKNDIRVLGNKPAAGLQRIFNKVQEMSAISEDDLEEMVEGFEVGHDEHSPSD